MLRLAWLAGLAAAFLIASLTPCPSARAAWMPRGEQLISAPCPCHCGDHAASSPASHLDPVLAAASVPVAESSRSGPPEPPVPGLPSAPRSLPDPVPIAG
jgi:hypothetical protein